MKTYAAYYNNDIRTYSSSGGIFSLIAEQFEVVYGVAMNDDCYGCEFVRIDGDIAPLRGSKYIQAKVGDIFRKVRDDLINGKRVLFSGTGCQINGLISFLGKEYDNLFLLDFICHGVPSPKLWKEYVFLQEKQWGKITSVNFRSKKNGWKDFGIELNNHFVSKDRDCFMQFFLQNLSLRPSCYECHAKQLKMSDITIADFWGIENVANDMFDSAGTSLVIVRTSKGQAMFDALKDQLVWKETTYESGIKYNPTEIYSVPLPKKRDAFFRDMNRESIMYLEKKYIAIPWWKKAAKRIKNMLGGMIR